MLSPSRSPIDFLVAESAAMRAVVSAVQHHASTDRPVLICGEHGTGRELVARILHDRGARRAERFVAVRPTFESAEPLGDAPAPAPGQCARACGALWAARGGTLLIKDACDLSALSQHTLEQALGAAKPHAPLDVRLVLTADVDLEHAVRAKALSVELYQAAAHQRIDVPALRDRLDDLRGLFERWLGYYAKELGRAPPALSSRAIARLGAYPWPGNVAELKSIARRLVLRVPRQRVEAGDVDEVLPTVAERVPLEDLSLEDLVKAKLRGLMARIDGYPVDDLYEKVLARVERPLFDVVLAHTGGNQVKAAELLGLNRNTLRKKLQELGMSSAAARGRKARADRALDE